MNSLRFFTTIINCGIECSAAVQSGPIEAWLTRLRSTEPSVRVQAAYHPPATEEISTGQAAILLKALNDKNSYVRRYVASVVSLK
jgi:HEAT repeat protein